MPSVPTINQVVRGTAVNIVLKDDQPTGRTVVGRIADVLTRGNHPRGIKVRLIDGRVGRVKSLATDAQVRGEEAPTPAEPGDFGRRGFRYQGRDPVRDGEGPGPEGKVGYLGGGGRGRGKGRGRGRTEDGGEEAPVVEVGLDAFLKPGRGKGKGGKRGGRGGRWGQVTDQERPNMGGSCRGLAEVEGEGEAGQKGVLSRCPVCDEFEGDERAVAHHVGSHFD